MQVKIREAERTPRHHVRSLLFSVRDAEERKVRTVTVNPIRGDWCDCGAPLGCRKRGIKPTCRHIRAARADTAALRAAHAARLREIKSILRGDVARSYRLTCASHARVIGLTRGDLG